VFATLVAGLLAAEAAHATESDIISIRPAQVLDVRSGKLRRDVVVQIQGERVLCVDSARGIEPGGVNAIDLPGLTLLPGLIDAQQHGGWRRIPLHHQVPGCRLRLAPPARASSRCDRSPRCGNPFPVVPPNLGAPGPGMPQWVAPCLRPIAGDLGNADSGLVN
jgi:hypothetical protein